MLFAGSVDSVSISLFVLPFEIKEHSCMMREVLDEPSVEISKTNEGLHLFSVSWLRPLCHSANLDWVHLCFAFQDDEAEVFNLCAFKLALLWSEVKLMLA